MRFPRYLIFVFTALFIGFHGVADATAQDKLAQSVVQLRHSVGRWSVVTESLKEDGSVIKASSGTYQFDWVIPDRMLSGLMEIPADKMKSAILFYVNERKIEMVSVGADGYLWVMTGALGEEVRYTQKFKSADGKENQLRFTRFNVTPDRFESRMDYTDDGGKTWKPGNHQVFRREAHANARTDAELSGNPPSIQVPRGNPAVLDGRISEQEWSGAHKQQLSGGGEIGLLHDGTDIYIGVSGLKDGWAHVYVSENEQIHVLHASAALGKAVYKKSNAGSWQPVQGFDWALRQTDRSEETEKARSAYFDAQGWLANNNLTGSGNVLEFKVGKRYIKAGGLQVAVVYSSDGKSLQYWPSSLKDDCLKPELVTGETPSDLKFNQSTWAGLVITQK